MDQRGRRSAQLPGNCILSLAVAGVVQGGGGGPLTTHSLCEGVGVRPQLGGSAANKRVSLWLGLEAGLWSSCL